MNEEAINDAYSLFKSGGYNGSLNDFVQLISTNQDALNDAYTMFAGAGYNGGVDGFSELMGLKKKEPSVSTSQEAAMEQPMATGSSELPKSAGQLPDFTALRQQQQVEAYGQVEPAAQVEGRLSPQAKAKIDERIKLGEVQAAPAVKGEAMVDVGDKLAYLWDSGVNVLADLSQNIRQSVTGLDRTYVYEFVENNKERLPELYNEYTKLKGQGASDEDAAYGAYLQTVAIDPTIETRVNSFVRSRNKEKVREEVGSDLSKEQREKIASDLVPSAIGGLIESTPAMLSSASTYGLSFFDLAYKGAEDMLAQEFEQNPDLKLTPAQQEEYKLASGAVMAVLEKIGLSNTLKANPLVRRALTSRVLSSMAGLGKDASSEVFERVVRKELGTIARIGKNIGSGFLAEAETGALQELSQNGLNYYVNETSGKTVFDGKSATELIKDVLRAGIAEGIGGGFIAGAVNVFANPDAITEEDFDKAKKFASEVDIKKVQEHLADEMAAGKITKDEASQILNNINEFRAVANSVPENVSKEAQAKIFKLIKEKQDISKSVAGKDEAIQSVAKEQIKAIDDQIKELYVTSKTPTQDAVQEQATDEGVLRPEQPEVGLQEVVEGDQEPQVVAEEGVEEEVAYGAGTIGTLLNERVSYSDPVSGETVDGDLFVDGQRVVLEAAGGQQFDLGNVDEVLGLNIEEAALVAPAEMAIIPQEDGSFVFNKEGNQKVAKGTTMFNRQPGLQAIRRDAEGKVDRVTLYSEDGAETYNLTGQEAEDAAYYIVRGFVETQEGQDAINQLAQRNEEARRDLSQPLGTRAVQQAAPQAPAPVRVEAPAGPAVEEQIADIERRRQEDLNQFVVSDVKTEKYNVPIFLDSNAKVRGDKQEYISREVFDKAYANDNREGAGFQTAETLIRRGGYTKGELLSGPQALLKPEIDKINAKYDAELAALKQANAAPSVEAGPAVEAAVEDDIQAQEVADLAAEMQAAAPTTVERLNRVAERARKAISKVIPDVKIIVHDTDAAYREASGDTEQGVYIPATKTIHINASKATPGAVAHEVFHAVFLDRVKTDVAAQRAAKKMVESLKRVVGEGSELYQYLDAFSQNYDANFQNEEKLAELAAVLAENYMGLETSGLSKGAIESFKQAVKDFINTIAKRFGVPMPSTLTDADVIGVLNAIAQKTVTGEVITEADVAAIDVLAEPGTVVLETNISPAIRQRRGLINVTEREAIKYAKIGINDQRVMQAMEDIGLAGVKFTKGDVETAIAKAFDEAINDINSSNIYNGESVVITQDSPGITRAIEAEIATLEEQGAPARIIDDAKRTLDSQSGRNQYIQEYQSAQLETLNQWTSYLSQSDYDPAFKLMMLDAVVTNNYDSNTKKYIKRDSKTIRNITPFDAGTLAQLYGMTDSKELLKTYVEIQADNAENIVKANEMKSTNDGKWLKFNGGKETPAEERAANATALSQLVQDTPWCTKTNASSQLNGGDFYVYVTKATDGRYIPRVAVRMEDDRVGELRGVASSKQDLEPDMLPVAEKFLREEIPNDSGKKWLDSVEYNKRIKAYTEELRGRKVAMDDFNKYAEIKADEKKYSVDYGNNGFVERLEKVMRTKVVANDFTPDLVGRVERRSQFVNPNTRVFFGNLLNLQENNMSNFVGLEMIVGDTEWNSRIENFPPNLKTVTGSVAIYGGAESIGNIELVGQELLLNSDRIKTLGNLKHAGEINMMGSSQALLQDFGDLEEINVKSELNFKIPLGVTSLGKIKRVNGSIYLRGSHLESFGDLEYISGSLTINDSDINSLGKIKTIGRSLVIKKQDSITSLGNVEYVGDVLDIEQSNIKDIPNLKYIGSLASFPYGVKSIAEISFFGRHVSYYNGTKGPSVKKINGGFLVNAGKKSELTDLGNVEEVTGDLTVSSASSLGNVKIVGRDLNIRSRDDDKGITSIEKIEQVGRNLNTSIAVKINSFGSIKSIGGNIYAPKVTELGSLQSVGQNDFTQKTMFLDGLLSDAYAENPESTYPVVDSLAQSYIKDSGINNSIEQQIKDLYIKNVYDLIGAEMPPQPRQRKGSPAFENWSATPKSSAQKIGHMYNMNHKGFAPKTIDPMHFKRDVERIDDRLSVRKTALGTGYYMTLDGKFFNPYERVIEGRDGGPNGLRQRINSQTTNIFDIVETARAKGYTDKTIELYLKQEGFDANDIKNALAVSSGLNGAEVPAAFGYVQGGMAVGESLFSEIQEKLNKMTEDGADKTDIRIEAQRLLMDSDIYKAQTQDVQAQLRLSLDASIGSNVAARAFRQEFKELRAMLASKKRAARELNAIKSKMRGFIRKNLPAGEYSKAEVVKLLKAIVDANVDSLPLVMEQVQGYVTEYKVRTLEKQVKKLLDTKATAIVEGRRVGRIGVDAQNQLAMLTSRENPMLANEDMSESQVEDMMTRHIEEYNQLMAQTYLSEDDASRVQALSIAMMYNDAYMMENDNPNKIDTLQSVVDNMSTMIAAGRAEIREMLSQQRAKYKEMIAEAYSEITGEKLDMSETPEAIEANEQKLREAKNIDEKKNRFSSRVKKAIGKLSSILDNYFTRQMDLPLLLSRITGVVTESFGGKLQETVDGRLFDARSEFTRRKIEVMKRLDQKAKEVFGKDYKNIMMMNAVPRFSKDLVNDENAIFSNMKKADELRNEYKSADEKNKKRIIAELDKLQIAISPNQDYYLYNQYKDPANRASFIKKFGEDNYARVMQIITDRLEPSVKEWADWQVDELYPSLYDDYNAVYRSVYRTNMPWNQFYAGRIYREGKDGENTFDLLAGATEYRTSVGGQSTKARIKNKFPIKNIDGNQVLNSYLEDMEYFRAYAEVMRDMQKLFNNPNIEAAINKVAGANTHRALKDMMTKIASRGIKSNESQVVNGMINNFIVSKLGFNPTIMLKQLTSAIAFSDYIGWGNWSLYIGKAMPNAKSLWKEWYDNSPALQERYENSNMAEVLEGYRQTDFVSDPVLVNKKVFGKRILISDRTISNWQNGLMYLIKVGDKGGVMGGLANYLYYKDEFKAKNPGATEQQAIDYASRKATRQAISTQQDSGITNKDWYQTSGPATRFLNMFLSSPKALFRKEMYATMQLYRKLSKKTSELLGKEYKKGSAGTLTDNLRTLITYHVGVPMFFQWVALGLPGLLTDWDEEDKESLGRAAILGNLNALFIVGDLLVAVKDLVEENPWAGEFNTLPIFEQANQIVQDIQAYSKAKKAETKDKHFNRLVMHSVELTGLPATSIQRMYDNLSKLADSDLDEAILRLFNFSDYVIEEKANEKKKK
jgi:hypothetical protein